MLGVFLLFLPNGFLENGYEYVFMYPYFILGYLANRYGVTARLGKRACFAAGLALFALLFPRFHYSAYVYTTKTCLLGAAAPLRQLLIDGFRWMIGLAGSVTVLYILYWAWKAAPDKPRRVVLWLGKRTLGLYVLSSYLNIQLLAPVSAAWPSLHALNVLEAAAILALSALLVRLLEGWRWSGEVLLGHWDG